MGPLLMKDSMRHRIYIRKNFKDVKFVLNIEEVFKYLKKKSISIYSVRIGFIY